MEQYQKKQLVKEAQDKAVTFIYRNYEDIVNVSVDKDYYEFDPMGGLAIVGYVNDDKTLSFHLLFNVYDNRVGEVTSLVSPKDFPPEKEECKDSFCQ